MADLTANKPREYQGELGPIVEYPMAGGLQVFAGAALIEGTDGSAVLATPTASGVFLGFANRQVDNRVGNPEVPAGALAAQSVPVIMECMVWLTVAHTGTWDYTDHGVTVYASDSDTFTLSAGTNNIVIGKLVLVPNAVDGTTSPARVLVFAQATALRSL